MVAIVSGNSLGLLEGSAAGLGLRGVIGSATQGQTGEGAYLNIATGNLVLQGRDDYLASRGLDVALTRTYNAQGKLSDDNGDNWGMGLVKRVANLTGTLNTAGSSLTRIEGDGSETVYTYDGARGVYRSTQGAGAHDTLSYNSKTKQWLWTDGDTRATETYDWTKNGRLIASTDLNKNTLTYKYNTDGLLSQITDASGENTYFDYAGTRLTQIRVAAGAGGNPVPVTRVRYEYDASNRLVAVITDLTPDDNSIANGNTYVTRYTYDGASTRVASVAQGDGTRLAFTYEQAGANWRIQQVVDGEGRITRLDYAPGGSTTVTDAQGYQTVYAYDAQGQLTGITGPLIGGAAIAGVTRHAGYAYDAQGNVTQIADALGNVVDLEYDANGNQTLQRDAAGNTVRRTYGSQNQLLTETVYLIPDPDGSGAAQPGQAQTTRYVYDSRNQLRFSLSAEGRVIEYRYNGRGDRIAAIQYNASAYDVGTLAEDAAPGEAQLLLWVAGADKARTSRTDYNYDLRGLLSRSIAYAKVDAMGNGIADGAQSSVRYVYDQAGQLLQSIDANNGITSFTYDGLGRRLSSTDALNRVTLTSHDDAHNSVVTTLANGLSTTSAYDKVGELIGVTQTDPNAVLLGQTRYSYDANGHLRMTENPTGQRTYLLYDAAGRKVADIDADGSLVEYVYDGNDQLTQTIRYANTIDTALLTGADGKPADIALAALRVATPGADRTSWNSYDAAGRLVKSVDVQGFVTQIDYDGASRAVRTVRYANAISTAALGSAPAPEAINPAGSAADRITRSFYDHDGKLLGDLDAEGYLSTYRYDIGGRLVETVAYATATDSALRAGGSLAQLMPAAGTNDIRQYQLHDSKGQLAGSIDGEGYLTEFVYDRNGNLGRKVRYATPVTYLEGATVADLRPPAAAEDHIATYAYTKLNQLRRETAADGTVSQYLYDDVGNLVSATRALGTIEARTNQMRFDRQGQLIAELSAEGAAQLVATMTQADIDAVWTLYAVTYQYDAAGRRIGMTDQNGHRTLYFYDRDGRLAASVNALGEVETRTYSAHNELTGTRRFGTRLAADTLAGLAGGQIDDGFAAILAALSSNAVDSAREFRYDSRGLLVAQYDELGARTTTDYDAFGNVIARSEQIDAGHFLQQAYGYDRRGLQTQAISDPAGINARTVTRYDAFGRAIDSTDANGNTNTRSYDRLGRIVLVQDAQGAALRTTYDAFDRVLTQTDSLDHITRYAYNTQQHSMTVSTAEGITKTVLSNRYGQQYRITDGNGNATTFAYDKNGDLLSITDALGKLVTHTYDRTGNLASTRDANGRTTNFSYDAVNRVLSKTFDPAGLNLVTAYSYDAKGQVLAVTDPNGIITSTGYDAKGQIRSITVDPAGLNQVTQLSYDGRGKTLQVTDANGHVTQYKYDTLGRRTQQIVDPDGLRLVTRFAYDANGNVITRTDANGQVTRFVYDTNDRATHEVDAGGGVTEYRYDANGRVIQAVKYANPISLAGLNAIIGAADIASRLTLDAGRDNSVKNIYDRDGRLVFIIDGKGAVSRRIYDGNGNVIRTIAYAHVIASGTPATVDAVQAAVDAIADATQDALSINAYDVRNRMTAQVDGTGAVTTFAYDANGNVLYKRSYANRIDPGVLPANPSAADIKAQVAADDAHDQQVRMVYDAANRLMSSATAQGVDGSGVLQWAVVRQRYDQNSNVVSRTAYSHFLSSASFPATATQINIQTWIDSVAQDNAQDRTTRMAYDAANRLVYSIDALNTVTQRIYDAVGNVVKTVTFATPLILDGTPDAQAIGDVLTANTQDHVGRTVYDAANRGVYDIDALGHVTERQYDAAGNVIVLLRRATPITLAAQAAPPSVAQIQALVTADAGDRLERQVFDADHRLRYSIDAEGFVKQTDYDALGRVTRTTQYANRVALGAANVTEQALAAALQASPEQDRVTTFAYDAQGNLVHSSDALGAQESYAYDALGRKLSFTNKKGATWDYRYDAAGRLISELAPQVEAASLVAYVDGEGKTRYLAQTELVRAQTRLEYDAFGNLTARTEAAGTAQERTTRYEYDAQDRQIRTVFPRVAVYEAPADGLSTAGDAARVEMPDVELSAYVAYDALGNAVMNTDVAGNRSYKTYDRAGRVALEIDAKGFVTGYTRDAFGNATALTRYADPIVIAGTTDTPLTQHHLQIAQFYTGLLNRAPDMAGFVNAVAALDAGVSISDLAQGFIDSPEARNNAQLFPFGLDNQQFLSRLYQLVLGREVDPEGAAYWGAQLDSGVSRGRVAADIIHSIASYSGTAPGELAEQARFNNKVATGLSQASIAQLKAAGIETLLAGGDHAADRVIRTQYDALGRTVKVVEPQVYAFDQHSTLGSRQFTAGKATETGYNAFGDAVRQSVYGEDARGARTTEASKIHFYFNERGERIAQIALADGASHLGYLSEMEYDAAGNLTRQVEYANGISSWSDTTYGMPQADLSDRETHFTYDRANRKIAEARIHVEFSNGADDSSPRGNALTTFGYDAVGNLTRSTDALGGTTYTYHDAVGRVTAVVASSSAAIGTAMPLAEFKLDIYGNVVHRTDYALGAIFADEATYAATQQHGDDRITSTVYDSHGHAVQTVDAEGNAAFASYDKSGHVAKQWQTVTNNDGLKETAFKQMRYDALGQLVEMVEPDSGSTVVRRGIDYNAFGEVVGKSTNGSAYEYADYDNAGRVWRTNAGDGVDKVMLHDIAGHTTADIRSATLNLKAGYASAQEIVTLDKLLRTETRYDLMGHVIAQIRPAQYSTDVANSMQPAFITAVVSRGSVGTNEVRLNWISFAGWGSGDVKVQLDYASNPVMVPFVDEVGTNYVQVAPAQEASYTRIFSADQSEDGVTLSWQEGSPAVDNIKRIQVWKKNVAGQWVAVIDQARQGTFSSFVEIQAPADPDVQVTLQYRVAGANGGFQAATLSNFGDTLVFDTITLAEGSYEYQIIYRHTGQTETVHDEGTLEVSSKDIPKIREQIARAYVLLFNRGPELAGLNLWTEQIRGGRALSDVLQSLLESQEGMNRYAGFSGYQIMGRIYNDVLGMPYLDSAGTAWAVQLQSRPKGEVLVELINWITSYSGVDGLDASHRALFSNKVDVGLTYAVELGGTDGHEASLITQLVTATDTTAAIAAAQAAIAKIQKLTQIAHLYIALLNRAPDKAGLDVWLDAMNNGMSWEDVANSILNAPEARSEPLNLDAMSDTAFVTHLYKTVLNRAPDEGGLKSWVANLTGQPGVAPVTRGLLATQMTNAIASYKGIGALELSEKKLFNNKVAIGLSYAQDLGYDDAALARAVIAAVSGASTASEAANAAKVTTAANAAFADKAAQASSAAADARPLEELRTQVAQLYVALLNRLPEKEGLDQWVAFLSSGKTPAEAADAILAGAEAKDTSLNLYPEGMSDEQFIEKVYQLVLNRQADSQGSILRLQELHGTNGQPAKTRGQVAVAIINGFLANTTFDAVEKSRQDLFNNKIAVGLTYALYLNGNDQTAEREIIDLVTATDMSVAIAAALEAAEQAAARNAVAIAAATAAAAANTAAAGNATSAAAVATADAVTALNAADNIPTALMRLELTRLYYAVLGREPDLAGLNFQVDAMQNDGLSLITLADNMLASEEALATGRYPSSISNEEFVQRVYQHVLGRPVDAVGTQTRTEQFAAGMSRGAVLLEIIHGFVNYANLDAGEYVLRAAFNQKISDNLSAVAAVANAAAAQAIAEASPAAAQAQAAAEQAAAATTLAAQKAAALVAAAQAAATAAANAEAIPTAVTRIKLTQLYYAILDRAPDLTGLNYIADAMQAGMSLVTAANNMLASVEAVALNLYPAGISDAEFVQRVYQHVLGRAIDAVGAQTRAKQFALGMSRGEVLLEIIDGFIGYTGTDLGEHALKAEFNRKIRDHLNTVAAAAHTAAAQAAALAGPAVEKVQQETAKVAAATTLAAQKASAATVAAQEAATAAATAAGTPTAVIRTELAQLYAAILGRAPDLGGLNSQVDAWQSGLPLKTMADNLLNSPESQNQVGWYPSSMTDKQFVEQVYQHVLGRPVDVVGAQSREAQLVGGMTRGELILEVIKGLVNYAGTDAGEHALKAAFNSKVRDNLNTVAAAAATYAAQASAEANPAVVLAQTLAQQAANANTLITQKTAAASSATNAAATAASTAASTPTAVSRLQLTQLYAAILNREPDLVGFNYIVSQMGSGLSLTTAADNMLVSSEAQQVGWYPSSLSNVQFVEQAYLHVLGRQVDAQGAATRASQFAQGMSRGQVLVEIITGLVNYAGTDSGENALKAAFNKKISNNLDKVSGYATSAQSSAYSNYIASNNVKVAAESNYNSAVNENYYAGVAVSNAATAVANAAGPASNGQAALAVSQDIRTTITRLYISILNRGPDLPAVPFWAAHLQGGMSIADAAQSMINSPEGQGFYPSWYSNEQFVSKVYNMIFGRNVDPSGLAAWSGQLYSGMSRGQVLVNLMNAFLGSAEYNLVDAFNSRVSEKMNVTVNEANWYIAAKQNADIAYSNALTAKANAETKVNQTYSTLISANAAFSTASSAYSVASSAANATLVAANAALKSVLAVDAVMEKASAEAQAVTANAAAIAAGNAANVLVEASNKATAVNSALTVAAGAMNKAVISVNAELGKAAADAELVTANNALAAAKTDSEPLIATLDKANVVVGAVDAAAKAAATAKDKATAEWESASADAAKIAAQKLVEDTAKAIIGLNATVSAAIAINAAAAAATAAAAADKAKMAVYAAIAAAANLTLLEKQALQVTQIYVGLLDRTPEFDGLRHWIDQLKDGKTLAECVDVMLTSDEAKALYPDGMSDATFITQLYNVALDRTVEPGGVAFWLGKMQGGAGELPMSRADVVLNLINGAAIGGNGDTVTFNAKVAAALTQVSQAAQYAAGNIDLSSFIGNNVIEADARARNYDKAAADHAAATPGVAQSRQVALLYAALMDRIPELEGFNTWLKFLDSATFVEAADSMLASAEVQALFPNGLSNADFVTQFYHVALGREPKAAELAAATGSLNSQSRGAVVAGIIEATLGYTGNNVAQLASRELLNNRAQFALGVVSVNAGTAFTFADSLARTAAAIAETHPSEAYVAKAGELQESITGTIVTGHKTTATPVVSQTVDRWGNVLKLTDARNPNWKTTYTYNANNQVTSETKPDAPGQSGGASSTTRIFYDQLGRTVASRDARGYVNGMQYDGNGNLVKELHADGGAVEYAYDLFGDRTRVKQGNGTLTSYAYDHLGRQTSVTRGEVDIYEVVYFDRDDVYTNPVGLTDRPTDVLDGVTVQQRRTTRALVDTFRYDELGRRISSTNAAGETASMAYDLRGNVVSSKQFDQETRSTYDAFNHKISETDANKIEGIDPKVNTMTWEVDAFGRVQHHSDLGGATVSYGYNNLKQLVWQTSTTHGQDLTYTYDDAGLLTRIDDAALGQVTEYRYDLAGNRLREKTSQQGRVAQDNHLGYDTQGRLVSVDDGRYSVRYTYDANGNRTNVHTHYRNDSDEAREIQSWNAYDEMNRQTVVDGVLDANGNAGISAKQGHRITYDYSGNRTSDTYYGKKIVKTPPPPWSGMTPYLQTAFTTFEVPDGEGEIHETYAYDAANRLTDVYRDDFDLQGDGKGLRIEARRYDAADRVVYGGMVGYVPETDADIGLNDRLSAKLREIGLNPESSTSIYEKGLLERQNHRSFNRAHTNDLDYEYDKAGNLKRYDLYVHGEYGHVERYDYHYDQREGYSVERIDVTNLNKGTSGAVVNEFDANGNLVKVDDLTKGENDRTLVNDAAGKVLQKTQGTALRERLTVDGALVFRHDGNQTHTLIVNGEVLGTSSNNGTPDTFGVTHVPVTAPSLSAPPGSYTVHTGDTLQGIAKAVWGDGSLWYLIAEANGLSGNVVAGTGTDAAAELVEGQTITIPSRSNTVHNDFRTFKPYDPSSVIGDTNPNLPVPSNDGGCGGIGQIVMIVIAVIVTIYTAGAAAEFLGAAAGGTGAAAAGGIAAVGAGGVGATFGTGLAVLGGTAGGIGFGAGLAAAAVGGAVGSIVSQGVGIAIGAQDKFSWKGVAMGAIGAGIGAGVGAAAQSGALGSLFKGAGFEATVARAVLGNTVSQGVMVATGLQDRFNWRGVAASAAGAAVGSAVGSEFGLNDPNIAGQMGFGEKLLKSSLTSLAAGTATAVLRGGRLSVQQVAIDAFGNALGNSIADSIGGGNQQTEELVAAQAPQYGQRGSGTYGVDAEVDGLLSPMTFINQNANGGVSSSDTFNGDHRAALNTTERAMDPGYYTSIDGRTEVAHSGEGISTLIGTSNPQAVGNFMRANGLGSDRIQAGRNYFVPSDHYAYGDNAMLGQAALNMGNERIGARKAAEFNELMDSWHALNGTQAEREADPNYGMAIRAQRQTNFGFPLLSQNSTEPLPNSLSQQISDVASKTGAISEATSQFLTGVAKGDANSVLQRAGSLHADKMEKIIKAESLSAAQLVIKTPTAKSAEVMAKYVTAVKYAKSLGPIASVVEFGADMATDPSIGTVVAGEANIAGAAAAAFVGGKTGVLAGTLFGPAAPIAIPVLGGVGAAGGALVYEFGGGSEWVKTNVKKWWNSH
jgi:YD repeat-containing protein